MQLTPRGPLYANPDASADLPANYDVEMRRWRDEAYEEALNFRRLSPEENRVKTYQKYIEGDQWEQFGKRARYKSVFYINKTGAARTGNLALLTDSRPSIEIKSKFRGNEAAELQARGIEKIITEEYLNNDMDMSLVTVADIANTAGTGFWKIASCAPGSMKVIPAGPDVVMPIQPGFHIQESTAVLYRTWKSMTELLQKYPHRAKQIERSAKSYSFVDSNAFVKPDHMDAYTWQRLAPQMKRLLGKKIQSYESVERQLFRSVEFQEYYIDDLSINESRQPVLMRAPYIPLENHNWWYWVQPGERLYPRKRLVIFAGDVVVYDGPSPYWHGLFPFACLKTNPVFWSFWGLSKYRDLLPVNDAINQIVSGVLDLIKRSLNPTVIAKGTSVSREAWNNFFPDMPGAKMRLEGPMANPAADVQFSRPPEIPAYVFQMLQSYLGPEFDKIAGFLDVAALGGKKQVPGGDTIEQMRDSNPSSQRLEGRAIEMFLRDSGIQAVSNIVQFYTKDRRVEILGEDGMTLADFTGEDTMVPGSDIPKWDYWRYFPVHVAPGSMHGGARDRKKVMLISLAQMGMLSRQTLLRELEVDDISDEELAAERAALMGGGGGEMPRMTRGQRNGSPV